MDKHPLLRNQRTTCKKDISMKPLILLPQSNASKCVGQHHSYSPTNRIMFLSFTSRDIMSGKADIAEKENPSILPHWCHPLLLEYNFQNSHQQESRFWNAELKQPKYFLYHTPECVIYRFQPSSPAHPTFSQPKLTFICLFIDCFWILHIPSDYILLVPFKAVQNSVMDQMSGG